MKLNFDTIIIGSGIAGMTAAIYLKRAKVNCLLLEKVFPGGQIVRSSTVENYPGFTKISGLELSEKIFQQTKGLKIPYKYGNVLKIINNDNLKTIITDIEEFTCKNIIIATGRTNRLLNIPLEEDFIGKGISYCATCDGSLYKNEDVVVIGGGNVALEEAIYLSNICKSVNMVHRRDNFTADKTLIDKLKTFTNINYYFESTPNKLILENNQIVGLEIKNKDKKINISSKGIFIFIGYIPDTKYLSELDILDQEGYVITNNKKETNIKGIYAIGDCTKKELYQLITAASDGAIAANTIIKKEVNL